MISNKRMHKKAQNKTYKFGTSVHKPSSGLLSQKTLSANAVAALLREEDPIAKAERERKAEREVELAQMRAAFAEEMKPKQQENKMADMKSELTKVINAWEDKPETDDATDNTIPEVPQVETKSNGTVSQTVFDYVRDHPNVTRVQVAQALSKRGYRETTVVALVSQFIRQKLFALGAGKQLTATRKTYLPMYHKDIEATKPTPQGIAAIATQPLITRAPATRTPPQPASSTPEWTVESVVDKLNIRQARAVYNELRTLLGED